jgi:phosphate transport system permease protein
MDVDLTTTDRGLRMRRLRGNLFEYGTLLASLAGILALGILLAYVVWDAFGLAAADTAWYVIFAAVVLAPAGPLVWYARRNPLAGEVTLELVATTMGGVLGGFALTAVLEVIAGPPVWFAYFATVAAPLGLLYLYDRVESDVNWVGLGYLAVVTVGPVVGTLGIDASTAAVSRVGAPAVYLVSLVIPGALVVRHVVDEYLDGFSGNAAAVTMLVAGPLGWPLADTVPAMSRSVWLIFLTTLVAPLALVVAKNLADPARRPGFIPPVTFLVGVGLLSALPEPLGIAGPSPWFDWQYVTTNPSRFPEEAGLYPAIIGSVFIIVLVAVITLALAIGAAVYLEEYAPSSGLGGAIARLIRINISNLAGVPSVVYGILGLAVFAQGLDLGVGTVLTAAFTLSLLILPIVIISAREAIDAVPDSLRRASYGMGATRWQTVRNVVLPRALPGTLTGTILALGRAIGETAPLIMIGIATTTFSPPEGLFSRTSAMPMQVFVWAQYPSKEFQHGVVAAGVVTLLVVLLTMNSIAILLRNKFEQEAF